MSAKLRPKPHYVPAKRPSFRPLRSPAPRRKSPGVYKAPPRPKGFNSKPWKTKPFGVKPPYAWVPKPVSGGLTRKGLLLLPRFAGRFIPWIGWGLLAYDLWWWYQHRDAGWNTPPGTVVNCEARDPSGWPLEQFRWLNVPGFCGGSQSGTPGNMTYSPSEPYYVWYQGLYLPWPFDAYRWRTVNSTLFSPPPGVIPEWLPEINLPRVMPMPPPEVMPIPDPVLPYKTLPHRKPDPWKRGNTLPEGTPGIVPEAGAEPAPIIADGKGIHSAPGAQPHARSQPRGRVKERKVTAKTSLAAQFLALARRALHQLTELDDFVDALWKALPRDVKWTPGVKKGLKEKMADIYNHFDRLDISKALYNIVENQIEDAVIGRGFRQLQEAAKKLGIPDSGFRLENAMGSHL